MKIYLLNILAFIILLSCNQPQKAAMEDYYLYVGAYTQNEEEGISLYHFNGSDGSLKLISIANGVVNPSYLAINQESSILLAVNEIGEFNGEKSGSVSSFKIDKSSGALKLINKKPSMGGAPCYVSLTSDASLSFIANYSGGNVSVLPLDKSGMLQNASDVIQHKGSGADSMRQKGPHAHTIVLDPNEKYALAADLGIDKVISYLIDKENGKLIKESEFDTEPGAGPRHLVFHENGLFVFIINELNSTITSCRYDSTSGALSKIETVSTLPEGFTKDSFCADIHISRDGRFLYGSNRGHDSIVVFEINQQSGRLNFVSHHSVKGAFPRNFTIDPSGQYLLVANQKSDNIVVFKIDQESGRLQETGIEVSTRMPVCLKMMPI